MRIKFLKNIIKLKHLNFSENFISFIYQHLNLYFDVFILHLKSLNKYNK